MLVDDPKFRKFVELYAADEAIFLLTLPLTLTLTLTLTSP